MFFGEMSIQTLCPFKIELCFQCCKSSLYILDISPLSHIWLENIFSNSMLPFYFLDGLSPLHCWSFFFWWNSIYFLLLVVCALVIISKKPLPNSISHRFIPIFLSKSFIVLIFTFMPWVHFELIFVYGVRYRSNFILLHVDIKLSQRRLLEKNYL